MVTKVKSYEIKKLKDLLTSGNVVMKLCALAIKAAWTISAFDTSSLP